MRQQTIAEKLENMENEVFKAYGMDHRPAGKMWLQIVLDLAKKIVAEVDLSAITPETLEELTADNFHTARHAAEIVLSLNRYSI